MTDAEAAPAARVSAANALLDRGYGKPSQHITGEGNLQRFVIYAPRPVRNGGEMGDERLSRSWAVSHLRQGLELARGHR
jgi:hypothetical protein